MSTAGKILLIDDDVAFTEANRDLLRIEGYEVCCAHDGESGIKMAVEQSPDLIVLDVMMTSDTEGFDVSRKIKDNPSLKGTPVILMTGIRKAMSLPFGFEPDDDWLPVKTVLEKPVPPAKLLEEVKKYMPAPGDA